MLRTTIKQAVSGFCIIILLVASSSIYAGGQLYRYLNDNGVLVIDDKVPPAYASKGYDILSRGGALIRRVPRQLSKEELLLRNTDESGAYLQQKEQQRLRDWDESLMLRYSDIADIEAAKVRAMSSFQIRITILNSNLVATKSQIERAQQAAADIERRGGVVPESRITNIEIMREDIEETEQSIAVQLKKIKAEEASYQQDIDRFSILLNRIESNRGSGISP